MAPRQTVLHSTSIWLPQTQTWIHGQVAELQRLGVDAHVVCERTENLDQFRVDNIHSLAGEGRLKPLWQKVLRRLGLRHHLHYLVETGKEIGATIVHSHFGNVGWSNLAAVRELGAKHVVTFYGYDVNRLPAQSPQWRKRYQQLFDEADLFLCEGTHMAGCIVNLGCPAHKVRVQHLGVDVGRIDFSPRQWQPGEPLRVLVAATFTEKKGIPYAIEALAKLAGEVPIELTIIGDAREDEETRHEKRKILALLDATGLGADTRLLGFQSHEVMVREAYRSHLFLQPSVMAANGDTEGGAPVSIIEMLASGMPVIGTEHCDIPEVMGEGLHHLLAPERDADALAERIRGLLARPELWPQIARAGRDRAETQYSRAIQGERLRGIYAAMGTSAGRDE